MMQSYKKSQAQLNIKMSLCRNSLNSELPPAEIPASDRSSQLDGLSSQSEPFQVGQMVWIKMKGHAIWPGRVSASSPLMTAVARYLRLLLMSCDPDTHATTSTMRTFPTYPSRGSSTLSRTTQNLLRSAWAETNETEPSFWRLNFCPTGCSKLRRQRQE